MTERVKVEILKHQNEFNIILRKFLDCWKLYTSHKLNRQRATHKAVYWYNVRLKQKGLNSLLSHCIQAKKARFFHSASLRIGPKQVPKCEKVLEFERRNTLKRAFQVWQNYTSNQFKKNALDSRILHIRYSAIEFHNHSKMHKFFKLWLDNHNWRLVEKNCWTNAKMHCDRKMLKKHLRSWIKYRKIKIDRRNKISKIHELYVNKLLRRSLKMLLLNLRTGVAKRQKVKKAITFHDEKLEQRVFNTWINYCRRKKKIAFQLNIRRDKIENTLKINTMKQWHFHVWHKKCCRRKTNTSLNHYHRKLAQKSFNSLQKYLSYKRTKKTDLVYLKSRIEEITLNILNVYIDKWRVAVVRVCQDRQKIQLGEDHWRLHRMKLYFRMWKEFSKNYKLKAQRNGILNKIGNSILLERYMNLWIKNNQGFETRRLKECAAASEYEKKIKLRSFWSWNKYVNEKILRKVEMKEAQEIHRILLLREGLKVTLKNCLYTAESRYENRLRCVEQSCIDEFDTMRKFFSRWLSFVWAKNTNDKERKRLIFRDKNENTLENPFFNSVSTGLVLPEYMMTKARLNDSEKRYFYTASSLHTRL